MDLQNHLRILAKIIIFSNIITMPIKVNYKRSVENLLKRQRGLNAKEVNQVQTIAKREVRGRSELKHRRWLYPKTVYSELKHNEPKFLFGGADPTNGLLNLAKGDDSIVHPNGGQLPKDAPGACRDGQEVRLRRLVHHCILSGDGANKNTMVRFILFSYTAGLVVSESDILLQPFGTGQDQGWPNIFLPKNTYQNKGVKFIMDKTYQVNGASAGASNDGTIDVVNWGYSGVKTFQFTKTFKNGKRIKYVENPNGDDSPMPAIDNYGLMVIPYGSGVSEQNENCGRLEMWGDMEFNDR